MNEIDSLIRYSKALYDRGLVHASGGNTSVRIGEHVWITQTGAVLGELTETDLSKVTLDGKLLEGGRPSKELGMHLAMYRAQPEARAIIHVHPTHTIAFSTLVSVANLDAIPAYTAAFYLRAGRVPMIGYYPSGAEELHHAVAELAPYFHAILLRQHGIVVAARNMSEAMGAVEEIEQCARIALLTSEKGFPLTQEQKDAIDQKLGRIWAR
ncbi:MAG: class II aldolase/adducin family protein [Anaerolineales bacterium]|nr:class II aldolase/adducin family protein [Anaerolineales bacterium]